MAHMTTSGAPTRFELSLHGLVAADQHTRLLQLLRAVCAREMDVCEYEVAMVPSSNVKMQKKTYIKAALSLTDVPLRLRCRIVEQTVVSTGQSVRARQPWHLYYIGAAEPDRKKQVTVRSVAGTELSGNPLEWLANVGYSLDFEFVHRGIRFIYANTINVTVIRLYKFEEPLNVQSKYVLHDRFSNHWLVEISMIIRQEGMTDHPTHVANLKAVASFLSGMVDFVQVDHSALFIK